MPQIPARSATRSRQQRPVLIEAKVEFVRQEGQDAAMLEAIAALKIALVRRFERIDGTLTDTVRRLGEVATQLTSILAQGAQMATKADYDSLRNDVNDATNKIAARIDALVAQIAAGGMSAADEDAVLAELRTASDALKALGADPNNPVPE